MRVGIAAERTLASLLLCWLAVSSVGASEPPPSGSVTLPLERLLELERERERLLAETPPPPVEAVLERLRVEARLLDQAVSLEASFELSVLSLRPDGWAELPLLGDDDDTSVSQLPRVDGAITRSQRQLRFLTRKLGRQQLELGLIKRASLDGRRRSVELRLPEATLAEVRVVVDAALFRLLSGDAVEQRDGWLLRPRDGRVLLEWESIAELPAAVVERAPRPSRDPLVRRAHGSLISTLDGRRITRLHYQLEFEGSQPLSVELPAGARLEQLYLNGTPLSPPDDGRLELELTPARAGDAGGSLELVLDQQQPPFHLSGRLQLSLPRLSWPQHQLQLDCQLPEVFDYSWVGGSLAPLSGQGEPAPDYSHRLPLPGKRVSFEQTLVMGSAPELALDYTVSLDGHVFR